MGYTYVYVYIYKYVFNERKIRKVVSMVVDKTINSWTVFGRQAANTRSLWMPKYDICIMADVVVRIGLRYTHQFHIFAVVTTILKILKKLKVLYL